jgi:BASS family bile acid:Na+ symporter
MNPAKLVSIALLVSLTLGAGLEINRAHLAAMFKDAGLLARALGANFVIVPLLGVILVRVFAVEPQIATGILLMTIAPGVPFVLLGVRKKGGTMALAAIIAFLFPLLSVLTVPVTASLVLPLGERASLPLGQFVLTLVLFQLVPLLLGVIVAERMPELAAKLQRPLRLVFLLALVVLLVVLLPKIVRDVAEVFGSRGMVTMLCIVLLSLGTGWLLGAPSAPNRRTLALGTCLRNIGLCATVATGAFADEPRVASAVLVYLLVQIIVSSVAGAIFKRGAEAEAAPQGHAV